MSLTNADLFRLQKMACMSKTVSFKYVVCFTKLKKEISAKLKKYTNIFYLAHAKCFYFPVLLEAPNS